MTDADDLEIERLLEEFENKAASAVSTTSKSQSSRSTKHHHHHKKRRHSHSSDSDDNRNRKSKKSNHSSSSSTSHNLDNDLKKLSRTNNNNNNNKNNNNNNNNPTSNQRQSTREHTPELTPEERDARTILCMQLAAGIRPRDLEDFFTKANIGKVRDARLITDPRTKRSKGVAYVEFRELDSVPKAIGLSGQKLLGIPISIKASNAEKNRQAAAAAAAAAGSTAYQFSNSQSAVQVHGPMKLYVGSLHFNITDEMLKGIFEPFGRVDMITLMKDPESGRSRGYAFVQFAHGEDAKRAMENLNGFELAGRPMKVGHVSEKQNEPGAELN